jgi:hypothetical protein
VKLARLFCLLSLLLTLLCWSSRVSCVRALCGWPAPPEGAALCACIICDSHRSSVGGGVAWVACCAWAHVQATEHRAHRANVKSKSKRESGCTSS